MSELKQEVSALNTDVSKLRHELAYVSTSVKQSLRPKNGYRPAQVSRTEMVVWRSSIANCIL